MCAKGNADMKSTTQTFNISFPKALVSQIDAKAEELFASRSDFLRAAAVQYLRDEQEWEYIFNEGKKIGAEGEFSSEEKALTELSAQRRASGRWFVTK
jgi:metal-responsive CopG/Arc/MetJ family transcriptional regulator